MTPPHLAARTAVEPSFVVETTRGTAVENLAPVWAAVVDAEGAPLGLWGEDVTTHAFPPRSTIKLLQALPLVDSGAADAFDVTEEELALACASHGGEDRHRLGVAGWLERLGLSADDLRCAPSLPFSRGIADSYLSAGGQPDRLRHNCSGKHAGWLTLAQHVTAAPGDYLRPSGPVQQAVRTAIGAHCEVKLTDDDFGVDGCGAPAVSLPLPTLAAGVARAATTSAGARLVAAMGAHPWMVAGTGRFDTAVITLSADQPGCGVITKLGADGVHLALDRASGTTFIVKSLPGTAVPAEMVLVELLQRFAALTPEVLAHRTEPVIRSGMGDIVGGYRFRHRGPATRRGARDSR